MTYPAKSVLFWSLFALLSHVSSQKSERSYLQYPVMGSDVNVTCGGRAISVLVSRDYLKRNERWLAQGERLRLLGEDCGATILASGDALLRVVDDFTTCGNTITVTDTIDEDGNVATQYKFSNRLLHDNGRGVVSRQISLFNFDCVYPSNQLVTSVDAQIDVHIIQINRINGDMVIYKNQTLSNPPNTTRDSQTSDSFSVQITVNKPKMADIGETTFDFISVIDRCWVVSDQDNVSLISNGCSVNDNVVIISNGESMSGRFTIKMFSALESEAVDPTLHCLVKICNRTSDDGCIPICKNGRKRRALETFTEDSDVKFYVKSSYREMTSKFPSSYNAGESTSFTATTTEKQTFDTEASQTDATDYLSGTGKHFKNKDTNSDDNPTTQTTSTAPVLFQPSPAEGSFVLLASLLGATGIVIIVTIVLTWLICKSRKQFKTKV